MKTILVTGGAGFIGSYLCKRLLRDGYEVVCIDNLATGSEENLRDIMGHAHFRFIKHDVIRPFEEDIKIDAIFHLASPASPNHHSAKSYHALPLETMLVNTQGTLELLRLAEAKGASFLFASTSEVYGDPLEHPQKEIYRGNVSTTGPRSVYDEAKRFGETITAYFERERGVDARIVRIFNTYGPHMQRDDLRMVVSFILQALDGKNITIFGDGSQTRSLCYVEDLVEGLVRLMFYPNTKGAVINLGNPEEHTVMEYAEKIRRLAGATGDIVSSETLPIDDPKKRKPDITKAKELLGWEPETSLDDGLARTIAYYRGI